MAKKQTFGDKVNKGSEADSYKHIKVVRTTRSEVTNALNFKEIMLAVKGDKNLDAAVKEFLNK